MNFFLIILWRTFFTSNGLLSDLQQSSLEKNYVPSFHSIYEFSHHRLSFRSNWLYSLSQVQYFQHNIWTYQHQKLRIFVDLCDNSPCFGKFCRKDRRHNSIDTADQLNHYHSTPSQWNIDLVQSIVKNRLKSFNYSIKSMYIFSWA